MARQIRMEYAGATYHVMARWNHGQAIYKNEQDSKVWLEAKRAHGEAEAGMAVLGVQASQLAETGKGTVEKKALAGRLHQRTAARWQWVCERLCMGEVSAVTRAMRMFKSGRDAKVKRMKKRWEELSGEA